MSKLQIGDKKDFIRLEDGNVLFAQGEPVSKVFIVVKGVIGFFRENNRRLKLFEMVKSQDLIGEHLIFTNSKWDFTSIALSDVELLTIRVKDIISVIDTCPDWVGKIMTTLSERLKSSIDIMNEHNIVDEEMLSQMNFSTVQEGRFIQSLKNYRSKTLTK